MDPATIFRMLGIDFDDFKQKMTEFLEHTKTTLSTLDQNIQSIHERQERMEKKLDLILEKLGETQHDNAGP